MTGATGATGPAGPTGPAGGDPITATIDMTVSADTTVYTVPSGKKFIPVRIRLMTLTLALDGTTGTIAYFADVDTYRAAFTPNTVEVDASENVYSKSNPKAYSAGDIIKATVVAGSHSIHTVTALLEGILYDA